MSHPGSKSESAANTVRHLTQESIQKAGKPDETGGDLQGKNEKCFQYLDWIMKGQYFVFAIIIILVVVAGLEIEESKKQKQRLRENTEKNIKDIEKLIKDSNNVKKDIMMHNTDEGMMKYIDEQIKDLPNYKQLLEMFERADSHNKQTSSLIQAIQESNTDLVHPLIEDKRVGTDYFLSAYYQSYESRAAYFDTGCHVSKCGFKDGETGVDSIEKCMELCYDKVKDKEQSRVTEFGFSYRHDALSRYDSEGCHCQTTGTLLFNTHKNIDQEDRNKNSTNWVYYKFI